MRCRREFPTDPADSPRETTDNDIDRIWIELNGTCQVATAVAGSGQVVNRPAPIRPDRMARPHRTGIASSTAIAAGGAMLSVVSADAGYARRQPFRETLA